MAHRLKRPAYKRRLTELSARKAKARPFAYLTWDTHQLGLALRVQPSGARSWKCIYSRYGRPRWLHLGDANAIGLADARMLAAEAMLAVAKGHDPGAERKAERGAGAFADLAHRYVDSYAKKNVRARFHTCAANIFATDHAKTAPQAAPNSVKRSGIKNASLGVGDAPGSKARFDVPRYSRPTA